jgi:hypothetical protein
VDARSESYHVSRTRAQPAVRVLIAVGPAAFPAVLGHPSSPNAAERWLAPVPVRALRLPPWGLAAALASVGAWPAGGARPIEQMVEAEAGAG